jgi:hypothetical protein
MIKELIKNKTFNLILIANNKPFMYHPSFGLKILRSLSRFFFGSPFFLLLFMLFFQTTIVAQVVNIEDRRMRVGDSLHWLGKADLGFNLIQNTQQFLTASAAVQVEFKEKKHFILSLTAYNFVKSSSQNILNDGFQHLRYNYDITDKIVWEVYTQAQYNERIRLRLRSLAGTGFRFKIVRKSTTRLYLGTSYFYEHTQFRDTTVPFFNHRLSIYAAFSHKIGATARFASTTYFQPILTDLGNMRWASDNSLLIPLTKKCAFRANLNLTYDTDPRLPPSVPDLIYAWTNGIRLDF